VIPSGRLLGCDCREAGHFQRGRDRLGRPEIGKIDRKSVWEILIIEPIDGVLRAEAQKRQGGGRVAAAGAKVKTRGENFRMIAATPPAE
jgi:hypothetical protein